MEVVVIPTIMACQTFFLRFYARFFGGATHSDWLTFQGAAGRKQRFRIHLV